MIRDDRGCGVHRPPSLPPLLLFTHLDRVLYDCPDCGRAHFVTVDPCPSDDEAAAEVAMVDGSL